MERKADVFAKIKGTTPHKLKTNRQTRQARLNKIMSEMGHDRSGKSNKYKK